MPFDDPFQIYRDRSPYRSTHKRHKDAIKAIKERDRDKETFALKLASDHQAERILERVDVVLKAREKVKSSKQINQSDLMCILHDFVNDVSFLDPITQRPRFRSLLEKARDGKLDRRELDLESVAIFSQVVPVGWLKNLGIVWSTESQEESIEND